MFVIIFIRMFIINCILPWNHVLFKAVKLADYL